MTETKGTVLVVDDDKTVLLAITKVLRRDNFNVIAISDPVEGLEAAKDPAVDAVLLDIRMPNINGMDMLTVIKRQRPEVEVVMMTGFATIETAVTAVKSGAYDYLTKPFENIDTVPHLIGKAIERKQLKDRNRHLEDALTTKVQFEELTGRSAQMQKIFGLIDTVSQSNATVLIRGESGTGKELVARAIHFRSPRKDRAFVTINCSALTETLLESELFGHVKGAFTGAIGNKKGLFEAAHGGTIFLDEIGDIPPATQVRLLRVLQEGEVKPVGANESRKVDSRVIAATNVDLEAAKSKGKFREDLFYRLNVIQIVLPPLRERPEDISLIAMHFVKSIAKKNGKNVTGIAPDAMEALSACHWPGNVRELENAVERAVVLTKHETIQLADLPPALSTPAASPPREVEITSLAHLPYNSAKVLARSAFEHRYVSALLDKYQNNVSAAARASQLERSNFRRLMKRAGIHRAASDADSDDDPVDGETSPSA